MTSVTRLATNPQFSLMRALAVEASGRLVRDNIRSALEVEVGAIVGGRRFGLVKVKARIEDAYASLRTARSGNQPVG